MKRTIKQLLRWLKNPPIESGSIYELDDGTTFKPVYVRVTGSGSMVNYHLIFDNGTSSPLLNKTTKRNFNKMYKCLT